MVTKVFNIQPVLFHQYYYLWFEFCDRKFLFYYVISPASDAFTFEFAILLSRFTRKDHCLFCLHLTSIHLSLFKTKTKKKDGFIVILN